MLQYPCFKRCFVPTDMFVEVAPDHLALACQLQLTSTTMHVCKMCIYQQICLNQLQLTNTHICSFVAEPTGIYVTIALDWQICPYACRMKVTKDNNNIGKRQLFGILS